MSDPWGTIRLSFAPYGAAPTCEIDVNLSDGDSVLDAIEKAGIELVDTCVKAAAERLAFRKASASMNGSIVDHTVDRLDRLNESARVGMEQVRNGAGPRG